LVLGLTWHNFFRSLFIWKPKEKSELVEKDERKIVVCGKAEKRRGKKNGDSSDESDGVMSSNPKKFKSTKTEWKLSRTKDKH